MANAGSVDDKLVARASRAAARWWRAGRTAHFVRDYGLFGRWTLIEPDEMRRRRANWPAWRRALRPIGATLWWLGIVLGWLLPGWNDAHPGSPAFTVALVALSVIAGCVLLGVGLEWRDRRREGRHLVG